MIKLFCIVLCFYTFMFEGINAQPSQRNSHNIEMCEIDIDGFYQSSSPSPVKQKVFFHSKPRYYAVAILVTTGAALMSSGHYLQYFCEAEADQNCAQRRAGLPMMIIGGGFISAAVGRASDLVSNYFEQP